MLQRLAQLPGFDLAKGLAVMRGKNVRYVDLLTRFVVSNRASLSQLAACLAGGQRIEAQHLAHSLKGAAATLGAIRLAELAAQIDASLRQDAVVTIKMPGCSDLAAIEREFEGLAEALTPGLLAEPEPVS